MPTDRDFRPLLNLILARDGSGLSVSDEQLPPGLAPADLVSEAIAAGLVAREVCGDPERGRLVLRATDAGIQSLLDDPVWDDAGWQPCYPGLDADAWFARQVLGYTIFAERHGQTHSQEALSVMAGKRRPGDDFPHVFAVFGATRGWTPSTSWTAAVECADQLTGCSGLEVSFFRHGGRWACRLTGAGGTVQAIGDECAVTGILGDQNHQGTTLVLAAWKAIQDGLMLVAPEAA